jgi:GPI mannosyltransferase 4
LVTMPQTVYRWMLSRSELVHLVPDHICLISAERVWMFLLSLLADLGMKQLAYKVTGSRYISVWTRLLFALSWPSLSFSTMTFTNTLEMFVLLALMYCVLPDPLAPPRAASFLRHVAVGSVAAFGCFVRFTFPLFAWPLGVYWLWKERSIRTVFVAALAAISVALICIFVDTVWYRSYFAQGVGVLDLAGKFTFEPRSWVIAPWNNFVYNTNVENLSHHGIHPRWTHAFVNFPLLFGGPWTVLTLGFYCCARWRALQPYQKLSFSVVLVSIVAFSVAPHQEARFLLPLLPAVTLLLAPLMLNGKRHKATLAQFLVWSFCMTVLFSVLHQGGITNMMCSGKLQVGGTGGQAHVIFYKTYMPPLHAVVGQKIPPRIHDAAGSEQELNRIIQLLGEGCTRTYVVAPTSANFKVLGADLTTEAVAWPHLSMEDLPGKVADLTLSLYRIQVPGCS